MAKTYNDIINIVRSDFSFYSKYFSVINNTSLLKSGYIVTLTALAGEAKITLTEAKTKNEVLAKFIKGNFSKDYRKNGP